MRAIMYHTYGSPDVLELQEVAKPVPKEHEILIHVQMSSTWMDGPIPMHCPIPFYALARRDL
jgi:hypothetical protein